MVLDIRRKTGANVSINTLYKHPSLAGFSAQVDKQQEPTNAVNGDGAGAKEKDPAYAQSLDELLKKLPTTYQTTDPATIRASAKPTVFLTGATGFFGAYLIKDIMERTSRAVRLIAHVRSAKDPKAALDRLRRSLLGYGLWHDEWSTRLTCIVGDLSRPQLGIEQHTWQALS
jgi:L-aminoadipate-semialdehyde dehydrogenase